MKCMRTATRILSVALISAVVVAAPFAADNTQAKSCRGKPKQCPIRLTLPQAVGIALNRNLRIADARIAVKESEHQRREAYSDMFPSMNVQYTGTGYRYRQSSNVSALAATQDSRRATFQQPQFPALPYIRDYPLRIDPYRAFTLSATLSQPVYSAGRLLANYKYARLGVDYSKIQFEIEKQDLILDVYDAYYSLEEAERLLDVANQSIVALKSLRNQTREFLRAGVVAKVDLLATEGQLATARIQRTQAISAIEKAKATLNLLLRYPQETPIEIEQDLRYVPAPFGPPVIYGIAAANRLEIRQANISVDQAMALIKSARADLFPTISLQVQGSRFNDDWNVLDPEGTNDWSVTGVITWTFNMFRNKDTVLEQRAAHARAFVQKEQLVEAIMEEVKQAYVDMKRAESDIRDNRKAVEYRKESFRINQESYKEKLATYTEVLDAQRLLAQAQGDYYTSLISYKLNRAILERRMGILK